MPIDIEIDHERRIEFATGHSDLDENDVAGFLRAAWSRDNAKLAGYDALIDLTKIERIAYQSAEQMQRLASMAADMDTKHAEGRIAIVAESEMSFGLAHM